MRKTILFLAAVLLSVGMSGGRASAVVDVGVSIGEEGLRSFYLAIGDYFRVPQREVIVIRERHVHDHDIPVVLFLAKHARVSPSVIIDMRLGGRSWMDIIFHYRLSPDILYVDVREVTGPPYGKAYGHYKEHKHKHKKKWKVKDLDDDDVVNLVNLRFVSEHYGYSADAVVRMREGGKDFVVINDEVRKGKGHRHEDGDDDGKGHGKKEKHKEKHKGHGKDKD